MTLVLLKAPPTEHIGMVADEGHIIRPGGAPPMFSPHCRKCGVPVEKFEIDPISSWYYVSIEASCHGKTQGIRIPAEQAIAESGKRVIWMFNG